MSALDDLIAKDSGAGTGSALDAIIARDSGGAQAPGASPVAQMSASPTDGQSFGQNAIAGFGKLVSDTGVGAKQLVNDLAAGAQDALKDTSVGRGIDWLNHKIGLQSPADIQQAGRADITQARQLDAPLMATGGGKVGYFGGAMLAAPLLPTTAGYTGAAALGAGMGAIQPATSWADRAQNTGVGALSSMGGQAIANGLSRIVQPQTSQAVKDLMDAGITPTPGQILGGGFKKAEEAGTSIPVLGDFVKNAQNRGIAQLNEAVANRALAPVGESLPAGVTGREAVDYVGSTLGAKYDALLPKMSAQLDPQFAGQVNGLARMVNGGNMGAPESQQFMRILQNNVIGKFQGQGAITGETAKAMNSDLGRIASNYARDPSFDKRQLGEAVGELQDAVRGMMTRQNPQLAPELNAIDSGYAVFKRMQRAAAGVGADGGVFSPSQLQSAVKALDRSKDKGAFARGDALLQDLSEPAKSVMAPKLNDSGTPYRSLVMALGAGAAGHFVSPMAIPAAAAAPLLYSPLGQKMIAGLLTQRPAAAAPLGGLLGRAGGPLAILGPNLAYGSQQ
jgi:hypothetical protein